MSYYFIRASASDPNESAAAIIKIPAGRNSPMKNGNKAAIKLTMPVTADVCRSDRSVYSLVHGFVFSVN